MCEEEPVGLRGAWCVRGRSLWDSEGRGVWGGGACGLTVDEGGEEHAEAAEPALLVGPHADHAHAAVQHHVVGHRAAELGLEVLDGATAVVHCHKVLLALVGVLHLVLHEAQVDLEQRPAHCQRSGSRHCRPQHWTEDIRVLLGFITLNWKPQALHILSPTYTIYVNIIYRYRCIT